jgi:hypothetical protein
MNTYFVAERLQLSVPTGAVDRRNNTVRGIRVVGPRSRNGRKYPPHVTAKHIALFSAPCNIGHHYDPRTMVPIEVPPDKKFGRVVNPRVQGDGINGDLKYNPEHAFAKPFLWACENDPSEYSFSVLQRVKWKQGRDADGDLVAESILEVASIDIVTDGGTNTTVFESLNKRFVREGATMIPDVNPIVSQLETPGLAVGFLADFFKALAGKFDADELDMIKTAAGSLITGMSAPADTGTGDKITDAVGAMMDQDMTAESRRFVSALVDSAPFESRRPPIEPARSVADLVAGFASR